MAGPQETHEEQQKASQYLSVSPERGVTQPTRGRSVSNTSSIRTRFGSSPDGEEIHAQIRRRKTQIASVDLSYWDLFKALFGGGLKGLKQRLAATMESRYFPVPEEKIYDHEDCEYILTVTVWPREPSNQLRHPARCVLDTGCLQGNIISKRLAESLGYDQADYEELSSREKQGGTVATGQKHHVLGAIRVSWSHGASTEVFRQMRFLVTESEHLDLVVGARSIRKWNLISPPNLGLTDINPDSDLEGETLAGNEAKLAGEVKDLERRLNGLPQESRDRAKVDKLLRAKKKEHRKAQETIEEYKIKKSGKKDSAKKGDSARVAKPKTSKGQGKPIPKIG